jgi:hypothetical protein
VGRTRMHTEADGSQTTDRPPNWGNLTKI